MACQRLDGKYSRQMTSVPAPGFDPDEFARRLARLSPAELREFLIVVNAQRNTIAQLTGEGTLSAGAQPGDLLSRVTASISTTWNVEAPQVPETGEDDAVPQGSASGTTSWTGTAHGTAPRTRSPAVEAAWQYLKQVSPQDNTQLLATLGAVLKAVLIVWLMTGSPGVAGDLLDAMQRELGQTVASVLEPEGVESSQTPSRPEGGESR